jgi:hypothetical protein
MVCIARIKLSYMSEEIVGRPRALDSILGSETTREGRLEDKWSTKEYIALQKGCTGRNFRQRKQAHGAGTIAIISRRNKPSSMRYRKSRLGIPRRPAVTTRLATRAPRYLRDLASCEEGSDKTLSYRDHVTAHGSQNSQNSQNSQRLLQE